MTKFEPGTKAIHPYIVWLGYQSTSDQAQDPPVFFQIRNIRQASIHYAYFFLRVTSLPEKKIMLRWNVQLRRSRPPPHPAAPDSNGAVFSVTGLRRIRAQYTHTVQHVAEKC